jgi:hypothetical protein
MQLSKFLILKLILQSTMPSLRFMHMPSGTIKEICGIIELTTLNLVSQMRYGISHSFYEQRAGHRMIKIGVVNCIQSVVSRQ